MIVTLNDPEYDIPTKIRDSLPIGCYMLVFWTGKDQRGIYKAPTTAYTFAYEQNKGRKKKNEKEKHANKQKVFKAQRDAENPPLKQQIGACRKKTRGALGREGLIQR